MTFNTLWKLLRTDFATYDSVSTSGTSSTYQMCVLTCTSTVAGCETWVVNHSPFATPDIISLYAVTMCGMNKSPALSYTENFHRKHPRKLTILPIDKLCYTWQLGIVHRVAPWILLGSRSKLFHPKRLDYREWQWQLDRRPTHYRHPWTNNNNNNNWMIKGYKLCYNNNFCLFWRL